MGFESPELLWGLLAIPVFFILALWKERPQEIEVPSVSIWKKIKDRPASIKAVKKPRLSAALMLEALAATLGILAIAQPYTRIISEEPKEVVIVLDTSASMLTKLEKNQTRFDYAREQIGKIVDALNEQDFVTIITTDRTQRLPKKDVKSYIEKLNAAIAEDDLQKLVGIALAQKSHRIFLITDHEEKFDGADDKIEKIYVGSSSSNVGITQMSVSRKETNLYDVFAKVGNFSDVQQKIALLLYRDGVSTVQKDFSAHPGANDIVFENIDLSKAREVSVEFNLDDGFELDNRATLARQLNKPMKVLVAGSDNTFLRKAIEAIPDVDVAFSNSVGGSAPYDVYMCNEIALPESKAGNFVLINPPAPPRQITFGGSVSGAIDDVNHAILQSCNAREIAISIARVIGYSNAENVMTIDGKPIAVLFEESGRRILLLSFGLRLENGQPQSWLYYPSFPIFWSNYIEYIRNKESRESEFLPFNSLLSEKESNNGGTRKELSNKTLQSISNAVIREGLFRYFLAGCILMIVLSWFLERK